MKKVLSTVLALVMLLSLMPTGVWAQTAPVSEEDHGAVTDSGTCGDALTWTLYESGLLLIGGTGDMSNWNFWDVSAPWLDYSEDIQKVVMEEGVTSIGQNAFCSEDSYFDYNDHFYSALTEIVIPSTVTTIYTNGLSGLEALETIALPASVTTLVGAAINNNYTLKEFVVAEENPVYKAVDGVLFSKDGKTLVSYPIGASAESYTVPKGTETIAAYAFSQCSDALQEVIFNEELTFIDDEAFQNCNGLTSIELPDSVKELGGGAFQECSNLADISLPDGMTRIGGLAFDATAYANDWGNWEEDCVLYLDSYLLSTEYMPYFLDWDEWKEKTGTLTVRAGTTLIADEAADGIYLDAVIFNDGLQHIGFCAFGWLDNLTAVSLPDSLLTLGDWAFYNCESLAEVTMGENLQYIGHDVLGETPYTASANYVDGVLYYGPYVLGFDDSLPQDVVLRDGTTLIAGRAFWKEDGSLNTPDYGAGMQSITFPASLTTICDGAFYSCNNLKTLTIPDTVTYIGDQAFGWIKGYDLDIDEETFEKMTDVTIRGYNDTAAERYAAENNIPFVSLDGPVLTHSGTCGDALTWERYDSGVLVIQGKGAMTDYEMRAPWSDLSVTEVVIEDGVTRIGDSAFANCDALTHVAVPDSVTSIGRFAFEDCEQLATIAIGSGLASIDQYAFHCDNLQSFLVQEDNPCFAAEDGVLFNKNKTELLCYPAGKTDPSFTVPDSVTCICDSAFENCDSLTSITIPNSVSTIGFYAFAGSGLTSVILPEGMTFIDGSVFKNCSSLQTVFIPKSIRHVGYAAFDESYALTDVYYEGSQADRADMTFDQGNDLMMAADWHFDICGNDPTNIHDYADATCTTPKTCKVCGDTTGSALGHTYSNNCDNSCNRCGESRTVPAHKYTNSCDTTCNECGATRTITHDYANATCTTPKTCKVCKATSGSKLGHTYSNACDKSCNRCGATRTITHNYSAATCTAPKTCKVCKATSGSALGHTYSNACDKFCNVCGATRTVPAHKYSNKCDTTCNVCKAVRKITHSYKTTTTKATLSKNGSIVKKCTVCGKVASNTAIKYAKTFKLSTTTYTYNGKAKTPTVTVKDSSGKLIAASNYTVSYSSGRKNVGTYKVTIKMKGNYSGTKTLTFKINPAKTTVSKLTAGKKSISVAITKKSTQVTGYQIQYSTSKSFSGAKTKTISSYKTTKYTLNSLSAKKTYYVRVRTYKTVGGVKYYSGWSTYKYVKTK